MKIRLSPDQLQLVTTALAFLWKNGELSMAEQINIHALTERLARFGQEPQTVAWRDRRLPPLPVSITFWEGRR